MQEELLVEAYARGWINGADHATAGKPSTDADIRAGFQTFKRSMPGIVEPQGGFDFRGKQARE